jgi:methyltransferase (TIGR00027 family)
MSGAAVPSLTGRLAAAYRARASAKSDAICADPWARLLAGEDQEVLLAEADASMPELETGIALRTAWVDDAVNAFDGPQVLLLAAGLDSRSARLAREFRIFFEVDHPSAQMHKRSAIAVLAGYPKDTSTFVPCDPASGDFVAALASARFERALRTVVVWEGATPYLTEAEVVKTLADLVALDGVERLVFDVVGQGDSHSVTSGGEGFTFTIDDAAPMLRAAGFTQIEQRSMREVHQRRLGKDIDVPFFDRWHLVDARR